MHPRTILNELLRLGVVSHSDDGQIVTLSRTSFVPTADEAAARDMLRNNLVDHILAGVHNLTTSERGQFLEQSVFADGLTPDSVVQLQSLTNDLWRTVLSQTVKAATPLCEADAQHGGRHRMRVGMYFYSEPT